MNIDASGYLDQAYQINSPNCDERPEKCEINLLVIHNISLPPKEYGGDGVIQLFTNQINPDAHPYYQTLIGVKVSAHFFIRRDGSIIQLVSCLKRAWHAGVSTWQDKTQCNDFSIGIELEGSDTEAFTAKQYTALTQLTQTIQNTYPIAEIVGHSDIAPGRKTDPGPHFDWDSYRASLPQWDQLFIGREDELQWLQQTWAEVKSGKPRFAVLRGESGFGKTKIVQKFYSWLSHRQGEDPNGYWPDSLLREQNNLRVNPRPEDFTGIIEIPWLWWGVRWNNPNDSNRSESDQCKLLADLHNLKPHEAALLAHKNRHNRVIKAATEATPLLAEFAINTATAGLLSTFKSLFEFGKIARSEYQAQHSETLSVEEKQQQILQAQLDTLHELLAQVLTSTTNSPALPLILVLDDAQWIDQASTKFIENLFHHAIQKDWPLLILATHWEQEWNLALDKQNPKHHLPALCQKISADDQNRLSIHDIDRLKGLETIIKAALPGLTVEQIDFLSQRADGNPRLLNEIIQWLETEELFFQNQDLTKPLTQPAIDKMADKSFKLHDIQELRFQNMSKQLKTLLTYASYQGMRFIKDLLLETAALMDNTPTNAEAGETLSSAIRPHAIVAASSAVIYEFRHRGFYDLAHQRIELLPEIQLSLAEQIINVGKQWLQQGKAEELPQDEQESFYLLLLAQEKPLQADPAFHLQLLAALLQQYQTQGYFSRAIKHLDAFEECLPDNAHIDFDSLPFWTQLDLIELLKELNRIATAEKLAHAVQQQCITELSKHGNSEQRMRDVSVSQNKVADVLMKRDEVDDALRLFQASLSTCEQILHDYGNSEQRMRDVSVSQEKVADVLMKRDEVDDALRLFQASLTTREQILHDYGNSEQRLRDVFISYFKLSLCFSDDKPRQCELFCAALSYSEKRILAYPQYASTCITEHERLIQIAESFIQALDDEVFNQQLKEFQQNLVLFKQNIGM